MRRTNKELLAVCAAQPGVGPAELAEKLDCGINATYLAVADLERLGLIRRDDEGRYHVVRADDSTGDAQSRSDEDSPDRASAAGG